MIEHLTLTDGEVNTPLDILIVGVYQNERGPKRGLDYALIPDDH